MAKWYGIVPWNFEWSSILREKSTKKASGCHQLTRNFVKNIPKGVIWWKNQKRHFFDIETEIVEGSHESILLIMQDEGDNKKTFYGKDRIREFCREIFTTAYRNSLFWISRFPENWRLFEFPWQNSMAKWYGILPWNFVRSFILWIFHKETWVVNHRLSLLCLLVCFVLFV